MEYWANQAWQHAKCVVTVTTEPPKCNHCVTKDAEIERLRNQLVKVTKAKTAKRNRAEYMRKWRAKKETNAQV